MQRALFVIFQSPLLLRISYILIRDFIGMIQKRCSWDWKVIDRSHCHISCYLNGGIHSDVASFSLGVPLLCTLRTIVNRLYTDVNHSSANPVAPPRFWHLTNTRIIGTDQLLLYYCITYTLKHYGWCGLVSSGCFGIWVSKYAYVRA